MKFRGKLVDVGCIQHFTRIVGTVSKMIKSCVLRITVDKLYFILTEQAVSGGVQIWCELPQGHFFDEFAMEGVSEDDNEIFLELSPENLLRAMKTTQTAKWVKLKLTKKHMPCLTVEGDLPTIGSHQRLVVHDIPVHVVARRHWQDYQEPLMPEIDVSISMPQIRLLRNVIDKMKNLSNYVVISANKNGEMKLQVETEMVSISTHFSDLINPTTRKDGASQTSSQSSRDSSEFAEGRIDIRRFSQFLSSQQVNPQRVVCNIVENKMVHFYLIQDDVSLQYFMPAVAG
ncbi:hypothetical protein SNE40_011049 [Patella caerulea]|uniref:Checkpoint protein n=1 Tax=Patella caerulea TaxID=87958 RepID=A0AAN8JTJ8_PATCE